MKHTLLDDETVLPDDYPMHFDYVYIVDNVFKKSWDSCTVLQYKEAYGVKEIRRCNLFGHEGARLGDTVE